LSQVIGRFVIGKSMQRAIKIEVSAMNAQSQQIATFSKITAD